MTRDRRLGRGLAALLGTSIDGTEDEPVRRQDTAAGSAPTSAPTNGPVNAAMSTAMGGTHHTSAASAAAPAASTDQQSRGELLHLNVSEIEDNPFQPRRDFSEAELASLAESLKEHDMLQPILVRKVNGRYQLISGERRLRAAVRAGWTTIPARVREADDRLVAELAIVENLQRKDLNPVEKAMSFKRYVDQHRCTQEDLAQRLKIDRSTIANLMRLLELPDSILDALRNGLLSAGHARALLPLGDPKVQLEFCEKICRDELSVREVERRVSELIAKEDGDAPAIAGRIGQKRPRSEQIGALQQELKLLLGTKVEIRQTSRGRGKIVIHFSDHEEFERIRNQLADQGGKPARTGLG